MTFDGPFTCPALPRPQLRDAVLFCVLPIVGISYYCADL